MGAEVMGAEVELVVEELVGKLGLVAQAKVEGMVLGVGVGVGMAVLLVVAVRVVVRQVVRTVGVAA
jgi:hypothetical protein